MWNLYHIVISGQQKSGGRFGDSEVQRFGGSEVQGSEVQDSAQPLIWESSSLIKKLNTERHAAQANALCERNLWTLNLEPWNLYANLVVDIKNRIVLERSDLKLYFIIWNYQIARYLKIKDSNGSVLNERLLLNKVVKNYDYEKELKDISGEKYFEIDCEGSWELRVYKKVAI